MNWIKKIFKRLTPLQIAATELREAQASLLEARTGVEWATAIVTYNESRVARLTTYINKETSPA